VLRTTPPRDVEHLVDAASAWIHRVDWAEGRVVTGGCPAVQRESKLRSNDSAAFRRASGRCESFIVFRRCSTTPT
jgi:hypothetical protein